VLKLADIFPGLYIMCPDLRKGQLHAGIETSVKRNVNFIHLS